MRVFFPSICLLGALALCGCESRPPIAGCVYTYECAAGSVCRSGSCIEVSVDALDGSVAVDAGIPARDAGQPNPDGGSADAGALDGGADAGARLTFAPGAYRRCTDDLECAVFGGNCVVELTLSRPADAGVDRVKVSDLDPSFAMGEGVCTLPCTSDPRICDSITVTSPTGASAPFTCQVVYAASSPYPATAPAFPFNSQLDSIAMARGVPFASVCRPPFQFSVTHSESFCQACTEDMQCGSTGACYLERAASTPRSGSCVESCSTTNPCAFGFTCSTLPGSTSTQTYCVPSAGTCGRCRDSDGDLRGVGRCGPITQPNTAVDCDDSNAVAYFDSANPAHAFPAVCGMSDVNCNGKSDDVEQLGTTDHCSTCGDVCAGRAGDIPHARKACLPRTTTSSFACVADCEPGYADCDGDVSNGCEQQLGANSIYAEDADGDGRGSMTNFRYVCSGAIPAGWVQNRLDCNDTQAAIYGGNSTITAGPELCDGLDNNCNGIADDPGFIVGEGSECDTGIRGVCAAGTQRCNTVVGTADGGASGSFACIGTRNPVTQAAVVEACDGLDNNCNGQTDEGLDYYQSNGQQNPNGSGAPAACAVDGGKGICGQGAYACTTASTTLIDGGVLVTGAWRCAGNQPDPTDAVDDLGVDSNCDGSDGDLSRGIFVRPVAGGGLLDGKDTNNGGAQFPVATVARALILACLGGPPCKDIYLAASAELSSPAALVIPTFAAAATPPVRIYGGFVASPVCTAQSCQLVWTRGTDQTELVRTAPARVAGERPFGFSYAAIEADTRTGTVLSLLLDQVRVEVNAPDPSTILAAGENAPSQLGLVCPSRGCGVVQFRNVDIAVESAMAGAIGGIATPAPINDGTGHNGCMTADNCSGVTDSNGFYPTSDYATVLQAWNNDRLPGRAAPGCADGKQNHGGSSAAAAWFAVDTSLPYFPYGFDFYGRSGRGDSGGYGGFCVSTANPYAPSRGGNGAGGAGGTRSGAFGLHLRLQSGAWIPHHGLAAGVAQSGESGSGGGGGCGCVADPLFPARILFSCFLGASMRGGGGGAGGCAGAAGGNGGDGGNAIALVLHAPLTANTTFSTSGTFRVTVGNGGKGGNGAGGGSSAAGGYGGVGPLGLAFAEYNGGHGGDGGGGGGGVGGVGGSSIGILRSCARPSGTATNGCGLDVPPLLLAAPGQFVTIGSPGLAGAAGAAGVGTAKTGDPASLGRTDVGPTPNGGGAGVAGAAGRADYILFAASQVVP